MENKLISIAMATFNGEKFLKKQLDSIYKQTYKNLEVIVSDDYSVDGTIEILEEYRQNFGLKFFVNEEKIGPMGNFAHAIAQCRGNYIALADQDDVWLPEKLEILSNNINQHSLICSNAYLIDCRGRIVGNLLQNNYTIPIRKKDQFKLLPYRFSALGCLSMFKKELLSQVLPIPIGASHDWWIAFVATKLNGIKYLDIPLIYYRQHPESFTGELKGNNFWKNALRFFFSNKEHNRRNRMTKLHYNELKAIMDSPIFSKPEREYLKEATDYYEDLLESKLHLKAVSMEIKKRRILYQPYSSSRINSYLRKWLNILAIAFF
ncbi:MAG: glycosyltransferase [Candidatus Hodarchaeota archaeon]